MRDHRYTLLLTVLIASSFGFAIRHGERITIFDSNVFSDSAHIIEHIPDKENKPWFLFQKIPLNTANAEQLCLVKGIGRKTAARIIEHRTKHGPFQQWNDLLPISGIGRKAITCLAQSTCLEQHCE